MRLATLLLFAVVGQTPAEDAKLPPMTEQQIKAIQLLLRETDQRDGELRGRLEDAQRRLTDAFSHFELDEEQIDGLQVLIGELQQDLLANYRRLQVGMRKIVGPERFRQLQVRIELRRQSQEEARKKNAEAGKLSPPGTSPVQPH